MPQINITEHIAAPPAAVWTFMSDLHRIPEWFVGTKEMLSISTEQVGAGTEYRELTQLGPSTSETTWRITTFRAPSVQIHESHSAVMNAVLTMTVEPEGSGTRLTYQAAYHLLPMLRPLGWLLELVIHRRSTNDVRRSLQTAKRIIEQEAAAHERTEVRPLRTNRPPTPSH